MSELTPLESGIQSILSEVEKLKAENARLQSQANEKWAFQSQVGNLSREIADLKRKLDESNSRADQSWRDANFWKRAVRYEQALKRPRKKIRHLPLYNEIRRAKRRDGGQWIGWRTNSERMFLKEWRKDNKRVPGLNGGRGILEIIMSEDNNTFADLTQRDATVAATVIQWLGTNCGHAFIYETERKIEVSRQNERTRKVAS